MTREWRYSVRCRKVMVKWRRRASHLGRFILWHNGCQASQLVNLLCDKTAAELHNSVTLLCGITAAELNPFPLIWSSVLISVTREWRYCGLIYKFSLINNIELKCSFVRCRKYHKSWSNGAAELHISVDLFCGTTAAELHICVRLTSITFPVIGRACWFQWLESGATVGWFISFS